MADQKAVKKREAHGYLGLVKNRIAELAHDVKDGAGHDGLDQILLALMQKARGVRHAVPMGDGIAIFNELPDPAAGKIILEYAYGKPKESIEITDPEAKFHGLPQLLIVPPKGWTGKQS